MANNQHVLHIPYMTHALPFGDPCSETMSVHARLVKINLSFRMSKSGLLTLYILAESNTPGHHVVLRNNEFWQRCLLRMNTLKLEIVCLRDHLIMLPS